MGLVVWLRRTVLSGLIVGLVLGVAWGEQVQADQSPQAAVDRLHAVLLVAMKAEIEGVSDRYRRIEAVVRSVFDVAFMTRFVLGRYGRELNESNLERATKALERYMISQYAVRFDTYTGEHFRTIDQQPIKRGRVQVKTEFIRPNGERISLVYLLHQRRDSDPTWRIVNVIANGVSELALRRVEYSKLLKEKGINAFIAQLHHQSDRLMANAEH